MKNRILITGGAGFIGAHLANDLSSRGYQVSVFDNLRPQVHGENPKRPNYLDKSVKFIHGDILNRKAVASALQNVDVIFHFAALVGVGQSMYEMVNYTDVNNLGTAVLLDEMVKNPVKKLIVASSMSIYGEGLYQNQQGEIVQNARRKISDLKKGNWELNDQFGKLNPIPTPEGKQPDLSSVYALSKYDQERLCLMIGQAYEIPTIALRFFNVYGPYQALSNPYTGVLAIFASRLLNDQPPLIFEDGLQKRDFINVKDVVQACRKAMESPLENEVFNVGSGLNINVLEIAYRMAEVMGKDLEPEVTGQYRVGDIRHCISDISRIRTQLDFQPQVTFEDGISELSDWLKDQVAIDRVGEMRKQLESRGLAV